jgi:hypothetical protein
MRTTLGTLDPLAYGVQRRDFSISLDKGTFRHGWVLGKSGTGKSTLLRNIIAAAIRAGWGVDLVEPHGDLSHDCLNYIPESRKDDLQWLDPESPQYPGIGMFDEPDPEMNVQTALSIFINLAGLGDGPETRSIFRNGMDAIIESVPKPTALNIGRFISDSRYAEAILLKSKNPAVEAFHYKYFKEFKPLDRARAWSHPNNKVEELLRPGLREFLCQTRNLNFKSLLDRQKILLCRLPKGIMGERPAKVLGSLILSKINLASFRRKKRSRPVLVVIDEIHNFLGAVDFETMLAESRKNGIHYLFATQTIRQMRNSGEENDAVAFGNASHIFGFRMSAADAEEVAKNFGDDGDHAVKDLVLLPNYQFRALTMEGGKPEASDPVQLLEKPELWGDEMQARKAQAWAEANTGTPKADVIRRIEAELSHPA